MTVAALQVPDDRFLLTSIFGGSVEEIVAVAQLLAPVSDGLELNLSCPHAKGYGMDMGQDAGLVKEIMQAVKAAVDIPIVPKLTPNVPNIGEIARAAVEGGADALCAINTVGPAYYTAHGEPVLTNKIGGMSGRGVLPIALKCIKEMREAVDVPIIGCGGVATLDNVKAIRHEGADIIGIGSALTGMNSGEVAEYFSEIQSGLEKDESTGGELVTVDMDFEPYTLVSNEKVCEDISILTFDRKVGVQAGEFVYAWIPGLGEKPFSALTDDPFSLVVIDVGIFTRELLKCEPGSKVYVRGPHGVKVAPPENAKVVAVAGGTGLAAVYQIARDFGNAEIFVGARTADRLYYNEECKAHSTVHVATDDGSEGYHGFVTELLRSRLQSMSKEELKSICFYNCGPAPMVHAAVAVQKEFCSNSQIFSAIDYLTKCGVGICGACDSPDGRRLCVDGPFLDACE